MHVFATRLLELAPIPDDAAPNSMGSWVAGGSMANGRTMGRATRAAATRATRVAALDDLSAGGARRVEAGGSRNKEWGGRNDVRS